jgi:hypothetical protein
MTQGTVLALRRTGGKDTGTQGSRDTGKREPMLSRGGTDRDGRPTGKIIGTNDQGNGQERGF